MAENRFIRAASRAREKAAAQAEAPLEHGGTFLGQLRQGATLNYGDELAALARSFTGGGSYKDLVAEERAALAEYANRHPRRAVAGQLIGGAATAAVPFGVAARGASLGARMATGAGTGGVTGAISGHGAGEGGVLSGSRTIGAAGGGAAGAALGGLIPAALSGAGNAFRGLGGRVGRAVGLDRPGKELAQRGIAPQSGVRTRRVIESGGDDLATAAQRVQGYGDEAMLADANSAAQSRVTQITKTDPEGGAALRRTLDDRRHGRKPASDSALSTVLGQRPHVPSVIRDLRKKRRANADFFYGVARRKADARGPIPTTAFAERAVERAADESVTRRSPTEEIAKEMYEMLRGRPSDVSFDRADEMQRTLSSRIRAMTEKKQKSGLDWREAEALSEYREYQRLLVESLDEATDGAYSTARGRWASDSALEEAFEIGQRAIAGGGRDVHDQFLAETMEGMTDEAREAMQLGFREAVEQRLMARSGDLRLAHEFTDPYSKASRNAVTILGPKKYSAIRTIAEGQVQMRATEGKPYGSPTGEATSELARRMRGDRPPEELTQPWTIPGSLLWRGAQGLAHGRENRLVGGEARILGAQGSERDELVRLLLEQSARRPPAALQDAQRAAEAGLIRGSAQQAGEVPHIVIRPRERRSAP